MRRKPQTIFFCLILSILFFGGLESLALADIGYSLSGSGTSWTYDVDITNTTKAELIFSADMTFGSGLTITSYTNPWETGTGTNPWTISTGPSPNNSILVPGNQPFLMLWANSGAEINPGGNINFIISVLSPSGTPGAFGYDIYYTNTIGGPPNGHIGSGTASPVPIPASAMLLGSGLLGIIGFGLRRQRQARQK